MLQTNLLLTGILVAFLVTIEVGIYLVVRYRTQVAFWCGLVLLSLAIELGCYLLQWINPAPAVAHLLELAQLLSYTLFSVFWLLFVFVYSRHGHWITPRTLVLILAVPITYLLLVVERWLTGPVTPFLAAEGGGSLLFLPLTSGAARLLFLAYVYFIAVGSFLILLRYSLRSVPAVRKMTRLLLSGPVLLVTLGSLELAGFNPFWPVSIQQLGCALVSLLALFIIGDLRSGNMLTDARETVIDQMQDGVLILDQQDRIVDLNPSARRIIGPHSQRALKQGVAAIWPVGAELLAARAGTAPASSEAALLVDGQPFTFDISISQLTDIQGVPVGRVVVLRNVTGREQLEQALHHRAQALQRANTFLAVLAEINLNLQMSTDPDHVNRILGDELRKLGLTCFVAQLEPETRDLTLRYLSARPDVINRIEKLIGFKIAGLRLDKVQFAPLYQLLAGQSVSFRQYQPTDLPYVPGGIAADLLEQVIRWGGLEPDMSALVLPLVTAERRMGVMGVWGSHLGEGDVAAFRIMATQVAIVIERAIIHAAEVQRAAELARVNGLVLALARVAAVLETTSSSEVALSTLGQELNRVGLNCAILAFDAAQEVTTIQYVSFTPEILRSFERLTGLQIKDYAIPRRYWPSDQIVRERVPVWFSHPAEVFRPMFAAVPDAVATRANQLLSLHADDQLCVLPLISGEQTFGAIAIWGSRLKPSDSSILSVFASQLSSIVHNVGRYEDELRRTQELARSNATVMALARVAARLDTTSDPRQVYETLGRELKSIQMNCMVGTLDETQQTMKIDYLSVSAEALRWAEQLGLMWPQEVIIPRRLWPTEVAVSEKMPYWDPDPIGSTSRMIPFVPRQIFVKTVGLAGMNPEDPICYLPMISEETVLGILAVWGSGLTKEDTPGLSVFANQVATAIRNTRLFNLAQNEIAERTQAEQRTQEALREKEVLLKEIHHRVKNNLQVVSSLLNLQSRVISDPQVLDVLRDSQNRVRSMALVHEKLYRSPNLARIDLGEYTHSLAGQLWRTYAAQASRVALKVEAADCWVNTDTSIACGLILNELISNSLKHAFPGERAGEITVEIRPADRQRVAVRVADDGVGFPPGVDFHATTSLGLQLVNTLVDQIGGSIRLASGPGTQFIIEFDAPPSGPLAAVAGAVAERI